MKHHIFSGKAPSEFEKQGIQIDLLNMELKRMGLEPVKKGRSKAQREAYLEEAQNRAEENREEWKRRAPLRAALATPEKDLIKYQRNVISAFMELLEPEEQEKLRGYDSDEIVEIAETYANDPTLDLDEAIRAWEAQKQEAFEKMKKEEEEDGEDEAGFSSVFSGKIPWI